MQETSAMVPRYSSLNGSFRSNETNPSQTAKIPRLEGQPKGLPWSISKAMENMLTLGWDLLTGMCKEATGSNCKMHKTQIIFARNDIRHLAICSHHGVSNLRFQLFWPCSRTVKHCWRLDHFASLLLGSTENGSVALTQCGTSDLRYAILMWPNVIARLTTSKKRMWYPGPKLLVIS